MDKRVPNIKENSAGILQSSEIKKIILLDLINGLTKVNIGFGAKFIIHRMFHL